jgi:hypothetical protein
MYVYCIYRTYVLSCSMCPVLVIVIHYIGRGCWSFHPQEVQCFKWELQMITNDKWLFVIDCAVCLIKYCISKLENGQNKGLSAIDMFGDVWSTCVLQQWISQELMINIYISIHEWYLICLAFIPLVMSSLFSHTGQGL